MHKISGPYLVSSETMVNYHQSESIILIKLLVWFSVNELPIFLYPSRQPDLGSELWTLGIQDPKMHFEELLQVRIAMEPRKERLLRNAGNSDSLFQILEQQMVYLQTHFLWGLTFSIMITWMGLCRGKMKHLPWVAEWT